MEHEDFRKIESLKKQKAKADKKGNFKEEADICNYLGEIYARCDRYDDAIEEHERELALNEVLNDKLGIAVAHRKLGECYCKKGEFQRALKLHKGYLALARECSNALEEQRALATIGKTYLDQRDVGIPGVCRRKVSEAAEKTFSQSLEVCEKLGATISQTEYMDMKARLFLNLGLVYDGNEKEELSNGYFEKALTISKKEQFLDVLYLCQCCLGDLHQRRGRFTDAHQCMDSAAGTARKMKDKQLEADAMYSKALIAVQTDDFVTARHVLKKSHKLSLHGSDQAQKVLKSYQTVRKIQQTMRDSRAAAEDDWDTLIPLYDKLGDLTAEIGLYKLAVRHYQKMLSASVSAGKEKKALAVIHVSIAETHKDDKQFEKAISHYRKEIECRTEKEQDQICNSLMSIGLLQEQCGRSYKEVQTAYVDAFNAAKKAKNLKLQVRCLKYLIELFKVNRADKLLAKVEDQLTKLRAKHHLTDMDLEEEESQEDNLDQEEEEEEEIVMSDLTESEDETEKISNTRTLRAERQCRSYTKKVKLTEFGETPLHKACIAGNLENVRSLLAEGHPLNVQDNNGWTPLHEAANNDHYEVTKLLIEHGANIDHRGGKGCEGLTPLIDAASAGNFEIMMLLIDKGANINAKDDHQMKALDHLLAFKESSGDLDRVEEVKYRNILQILRERDPGYRSKHGSASVGLSQRASGALVSESKRKSSAGSQRRSRNDIIMESDSDSDDGIRTRQETVSSLDTDSLDDLPSLYTNPHLQEVVYPDRNARETYRQTMAEVGRSGCQASQSKSSAVKPKEKPALLRENEMVDDWLVEDMQPLKRRKVDVNGYMSTLGVRTKRTSCDSPSERTDPSQGSASRKKKRPLSIDSDSESESLDDAVANVGEDDVLTDNMNVADGGNGDIDYKDDVGNDDDDDDDNVRFLFEEIERESNYSSQRRNCVGESNFSTTNVKKKPKQTKLTGFVQKTEADAGSCSLTQALARSVIHTETKGVNNAVSEKPRTSVLKVKVQIKGEMFFIPVIESNGPKTFSWLAEEAAARYYKKYGLKPHVTLGTTDGAHFSPDDVISLMVADGDKIEGFLEGWDLPPITERYTEACKLQKTVAYKNVQLLLQSGEATGRLELLDLALRPARFKPVTRAIQCQTCLRHLDIRGNRIGDLGIESLCAVLATLPNLTHLGLACNDITPEGLKHLCGLLASDMDRPLQSLSSLDLGHNPLYDSCLSQLAGLVSGLPGLTQLGLSGCNLTVKLFQNNRLQLTEALHKSSVQEVDLSYNTLGCVGIELFLKCQNPTKIQTLDLSATLTGSGSSQVYRHLYNYCTQDNCALQSLRLCNCNLGVEDTDFLTRPTHGLETWKKLEAKKGLPSLAKHLQRIHLSGNPRLTNVVLQQLLQSSATEGSHLEELYINDCKLCSPLGVELLDYLAEKLGTGVPLRRLEFTCHKLEKVDTDSLGQIWRDRWRELADFTCQGEIVKLYVRDT